MNWQNLYLLLAPARCGSLPAAARELGVDHTTVGRRIATPESSLGLRPTERLPRHTTLTGHGRITASGADEAYRIADRI